jgi:hypothetical protein
MHVDYRFLMVDAMSRAATPADVTAERSVRMSEQLERRRRLYSTRLWEASERLWHHTQIHAIYPHILFRMHCMARATLPLMEAAVTRLRSFPAGDPVAAGLLAYFVDHIPKERDHDDWILKDLEALGVDRREVLKRLPPLSVASMVGAQYYWIQHSHPVALLGYIVVVEGDTPTVAQIEATLERTGLRREAFRTYFRHAILEPEHNRAYDHLVDSLPLSEAHVAHIGVSMLHSAQEAARSAEEILASIACRPTAVRPLASS